MTCLNNTRHWFYYSSHVGFEEDSSKLVLKCLMYKTHRHAYITWHAIFLKKKNKKTSWHAINCAT